MAGQQDSPRTSSEHKQGCCAQHASCGVECPCPWGVHTCLNACAEASSRVWERQPGLPVCRHVMSGCRDTVVTHATRC
jgi:hypothetical protein